MATGKIEAPKFIIKRFQLSGTSAPAAASERGTVTVPITTPSGYEIIAAVLQRTLNPNWITGGVESFDSTGVVVKYHNEYTSSVSSGSWTIMCVFQHL